MVFDGLEDEELEMGLYMKITTAVGRNIIREKSMDEERERVR